MRINILKEAQTYAYRIYIKLDNYTLDNAKKIFGKYFDIVKLYYEEYRMKDKIGNNYIINWIYAAEFEKYKIRQNEIAIKYKSAFSLEDGKLGSWADIENYNKELKIEEDKLHKAFSRDYDYRVMLNKYNRLKMKQKLIFQQMATKGSNYEDSRLLFYITQAELNDIESQMFDRIKELVNVK